LSSGDHVKIDNNEQLSPSLWNALVKHRARYACEECGYRPPEGSKREEFRNTGLHAHHLDANRDNNCLSNGQCLCHACHSRASALTRHDSGQFGRASWKQVQLTCEHCGKSVLSKNYQKHLRARHKAVVA